MDKNKSGQEPVRMKLNLDLANMKQPQQVYDYKHKQLTLRHLDSNPDQNCTSRILRIQTRELLHGKFAGARAPQHACVEHNQDEHERDLLRSMFGGPTRSPSELLI